MSNLPFSIVYKPRRQGFPCRVSFVALQWWEAQQDGNACRSRRWAAFSGSTEGTKKKARSRAHTVIKAVRAFGLQYTFGVIAPLQNVPLGFSPVHRLGDGHEVHAAVRKTVILCRRQLEVHAVEDRRRSNLLCRCVLGVDSAVALCQRCGCLAAACVTAGGCIKSSRLPAASVQSARFTECAWHLSVCASAALRLLGSASVLELGFTATVHCPLAPCSMHRKLLSLCGIDMNQRNSYENSAARHLLRATPISSTKGLSRWRGSRPKNAPAATSRATPFSGGPANS
jgi:hypothetical protein